MKRSYHNTWQRKTDVKLWSFCKVVHIHKIPFKTIERSKCVVKVDVLLTSLPIPIVQTNNLKLATTLFGVILKKFPHTYTYTWVYACVYTCAHVYYICIWSYEVTQVGLKLAQLLAIKDKFVTFNVYKNIVYRNICLGNMYYNFRYLANILNIRSRGFDRAQYFLI